MIATPRTTPEPPPHEGGLWPTRTAARQTRTRPASVRFGALDGPDGRDNPLRGVRPPARPVGSLLGWNTRLVARLDVCAPARAEVTIPSSQFSPSWGEPPPASRVAECAWSPMAMRFLRRLTMHSDTYQLDAARARARKAGTAVISLKSDLAALNAQGGHCASRLRGALDGP